MLGVVHMRAVAAKDRTSSTSSASSGSSAAPGPVAGSVQESIQIVKDYVRQETLGPLRGAGRWIGFGLGGAISIAVGTAFLVLGVLRMFQTEMAGTFAGRWMSLLPYAIGLVFCLLVIALSFARISRQPLAKPEPDTTASRKARSNRKDR